MHDIPAIPAGYVRVAEAIRIAGLPYRPDHIARLIRGGKVPGCRVGGLWFTSPRELSAMIQVAVPAVHP